MKVIKSPPVVGATKGQNNKSHPTNDNDFFETSQQPQHVSYYLAKYFSRLEKMYFEGDSQ